ncbi:MAG: HAMP domain-containing sensor histidine kinase [Acidimicrobiia bacterium]|nr:HAMP domain-containing sensor histidine kinase [Acidimicrobiia bacterium]
MSTSELGLRNAPVEYAEVRSRVNTVRAIFGAVTAILAISGVVEGVDPAPWILVIALYLTADSLWRRSKGTSALPMLATDTLVIAAIALVKGDPALVVTVAFLYVLVGALLLLPVPTAVATIFGSLIVLIPVAVLSPLGDPQINETRELVFTIATVALVSLIIGTLVYGAVQAVHDSTLRHQHALDAERRAVELKDEFVSMVSHEFRTPLTSIAGFSETLRSNWPDLDPEEIAEFLIIMRQEAHHLSNLVEDILVIPRIEAGRLRMRPQEFDLAGEIAATSRLVFADTGIEVNIAVPGGVLVEADRGRTGQILRNLLDNARKYGGDAVEVEGDAGTNIYTVSVADNGPGIPEKDWERIFEHFEQVEKGDSRLSEGVGLGLPIARQLARAMGGNVWYAPRFPTGASFQFSMKLSRIIPDAPDQTDDVDATEIDEDRPTPS